MKKSGRLQGMCDSCQEVGDLYGTEQYGEWLCLSCKEFVYGKDEPLQIANGKIFGLGI